MPMEVPPTKITIHHVFDNSLHFNHKLNVTIRTINTAIKLIFKNNKDQAAITVMNGTNSNYTSNWTHIEDDRVKAIQKIALAMKVSIPKRFESKTALREFITTRDFIQQMKTSMSS